MTRSALVASCTLALFITVPLVGCGKSKAPNAAAAASGEARSVRVAKVEMKSLSGGIAASGLLVSREEAAAGSELVDYRVAKVFVEEGAMVKQGQPLVQLDDTLLRAQIDQQKALLQQQTLAAQLAQDEARRVAGLDGRGVLSDEQIQQRRFQAENAKAALAAQTAQLKEFLTRHDRMTVRAPVAGRVLERTVRPGDVSGGGAYFKIARGGLVELDAEAPELDLVKLDIGDKAQVTLSSGRVLEGRIRLISPKIDVQSRLGRVRIQLPLDPELRPGGYAKAVFIGSAKPVRVVPESAVRFDADGASLMTVDAKGKVSQIEIKTGQRSNGYVEIVQGPAAGDTVVLGAASFVINGDTIKTYQATAAKSAN
jgi:HlyD family secretion protein